MHIEVLYVDDCPNHAETVDDVRRLVHELGISADVEAVRVEDRDEAERRRFLGSPTVRVDGVDVEPGAETRTDYSFACRVYRTGAGYAGRPDERWIREALAG